MNFLYFFFAGLVVAAGLLILMTPHILYAVLGLLGVLLGMAAIYFLQGAAFLAVAQVLVYGSGVLVLLFFSSFLLPLAPRPALGRRPWMFGSTVVVLVAMVLSPLVWAASERLHGQMPVSVLPADVVATLGFQLVGPYALAFEWTGVVLLVALTGALYILESTKNPNEGEN